jgi:pyridoxal phosphate enzyme (YggS family)
LPAALSAIRARIEAACRRAGRAPEEVTLIGATKAVPAETIREALAAGLSDFAENYVNELAAKAAAVSARWHFIGRLQTGTVGRVAELAQMVHSAEPGRALSKLSRRAQAAERAVPCLAQVDFTEGRRQGVSPKEVGSFLAAVAELKGVALVGLMTVPPFTDDPEGGRRYFRRLLELRDGLSSRWPELRELSMGMSADFEIAVEEGATMVRVGTALFGERPARAPGDGAQPTRPGRDDL